MIYEKIDYLLDKKQINRKYMCNELNIPYSTYANMCARKSESISMKVIVKISKYFNVTVDYLMRDDFPLEPIMYKNDKIQELQVQKLPQDKEELLNNYDKLNTQGKEEASKRVEELTHMEKYTNTEQKDECPIDHDIARKYFLHIDKKTNQPVFSIPFWEVLEEIRKNSDTVTEQLIAYGGSGNFSREISREEAEIKKKAIEEVLNNKKDNEL